MDFTLDHLKKMFSYGRIVSANKEALAEMQNMFEWAVHEIERLKEEVERSKKCQSCGGSGKVEVSHDPYMAYPCECVLFEEAIEKYPRLVQENKRLRTALEWYADKENYVYPEAGDYKVADPEVLDDKGHRACEALKGSP